jgi:hypothetical protein
MVFLSLTRRIFGGYILIHAMAASFHILTLTCLQLNNIELEMPPRFNWAPRREGVLGWRQSSTHFDLATCWRWVLSFTFRPLYPRKEPLVPIGWEDWCPPPELAWTRWRREKFPALARTRTIDHPEHSAVPLSYPGSQSNIGPKLNTVTMMDECSGCITEGVCPNSI